MWRPKGQLDEWEIGGLRRCVGGRDVWDEVCNASVDVRKPNRHVLVGSHRDKSRILSGRHELPAAVSHFFMMNEVTQNANIANRQSPANQSPYWT